MAKGARVIVSSEPRGITRAFFVSTGEKPGTIMQVDTATALKSGRNTLVVYNRDADGDRPKGALWVLLEDSGQGKTLTDAYTAGDMCEAYAPEHGDQLNLLYQNESGTADDVAAGDQFMVKDGTGKVTLTTGTPETEVAVALEALTDPTADTHVWSEWSGY